MSLPGTREISIDIGVRNYAIRVEEWGWDGTPRGILFDLVDPGQGCAKNYDMAVERLNHYLYEHRACFANATVVLVEEQRYYKPQLENYTRNLRLMQATLSYFQIWHPEITRVELSPLCKSAIGSGAPKKMTRPQLKEWSVARAIELLAHYGDERSLAVIQRAKKKDDLTDTVIQLHSYRMRKITPT